MSVKLPSSLTPWLQSVLRMVVAFLFMAHGAQKLFGVPANQPRHTVALLSLMGLAGVLEAFGGLLVFLGAYTRPVAFLLSGEMAVAYFRSHAHRAFWPILNGGETAVLFCFVFLFLAAAGGGAWSVDAWVRKVR